MSAITDIPQSNLTDHPDFAALVLNVLLFKLGGQITIPITQLSDISKEYPKIRIALLEARVTLTLLSAEGGGYGEEGPEGKTPISEETR
jgi:hypothetical protein